MRLKAGQGRELFGVEASFRGDQMPNVEMLNIGSTIDLRIFSTYRKHNTTRNLGKGNFIREVMPVPPCLVGDTRPGFEHAQPIILGRTYIGVAIATDQISG